MLEISLLATEVAGSSSAELLRRVRFESETPIQSAIEMLRGLKADLSAFIDDDAFFQFLDGAASRNDFQIIVSELIAAGINVLMYEVPEGQINEESIETGMVEYLILDSEFLEYPFAQKIMLPEGTRVSEALKQVADTSGLTDTAIKTNISSILKKIASDEDKLGYADGISCQWFANLLNKAGIQFYAVVDAITDK